MEIQIYHILPRNDIEEHSECGDCKCNPRIEKLSDRVLIIHNSFDGREAVELANEILKGDVTGG
jgi:hypothetical protein